MLTTRLLLSLALTIAATGVAVADAHAPTYTRRVATVGETFELNGQSYTLVRVPFKTFEGVRYAVIYPRAKYFGGTGFKTVHSTKPFTSNATTPTMSAPTSAGTHTLRYCTR